MRAAGKVAFGLFIKIFAFFAIFTLNCNAQANVPNTALQPYEKFEYKYSFKPPYLAQRDGSVPFWEYGGNAIASEQNIRLVPSLRSQKGAAWTKTQTNFQWWDVDIAFRVTGRNRIGADGFAFWYTTEKGDYNGNVYGSSDRWNGLALIFDSFDNDNRHNNPALLAVVNDGTIEFNHAGDGNGQTLATCLRDYRNKQYPTRARIRYYKNVLTVMYHDGMSHDNHYELCMRVENVVLPLHGYFGLSAATGGLADDHDVVHFLATSLSETQAPAVEAQRPVASEEAKITQEYKDYEEKLQKQREEYKKDHPDAHIKHQDEYEEAFETDDQREFRLIAEVQNNLLDLVRTLSRKLDEVVGRQESVLSLVTRTFNSVTGLMGSQQVGGLPQQPPVAAIPQQAVHPVGGVISRPEVELLIANQNILITAVSDVRQLVANVNARTDAIFQKQQAAGAGTAPAGAAAGHAQPIGYDNQALINEMRDGMNVVKQSLSHVTIKLNERPQAAPQIGSCPTQNCLGVTLFLGITAAQLLIFFIYGVWKNRSESQAKKFY